jgi:hypothetical protein
MPSEWKPCAGETAEPGASGTPPAITMLAVATCAPLAAPVVYGTMQVTDPDGDAQLMKVGIYAGSRVDGTDVVLSPAGHSGTGWSGDVDFTVSNMSVMTQASYDVRVKVTDVAGNQSVPMCNTITLLP